MLRTAWHQGEQELLPFVRHTGFDGSEEDWMEVRKLGDEAFLAKDYLLLCEDYQCEASRGEVS